MKPEQPKNFIHDYSLFEIDTVTIDLLHQKELAKHKRALVVREGMVNTEHWCTLIRVEGFRCRLCFLKPIDDKSEQTQGSYIA
jgi:hypothetical protein